MHPPQRGQMLIVKALNANGQAGHACLPKRFEAIFFKSAGVGFKRYLAVGVDFEPGPNSGQQLVNRLRRKQTGSTAANEYAVDGAAPNQRQRGLHISR